MAVFSVPCRPLFPLALVGLLTACGSGGGGGDSLADAVEVVPPATLSGTITAAANNASDSDSNDPYSPLTANNDFDRAQALPAPVIANGFVCQSATGVQGDRFETSADPTDVYRLTLGAGQVVQLQTVSFDTGNRLSLELYDADLNLVASSGAAAASYSLTVPASGQYYVMVEATQGKSKYLLATGVGDLGAASRRQFDGDFVPDEAIVQLRKPGRAGAVASAMATQNVSLSGLEVSDGPLLARFGEYTPLRVMAMTSGSDVLAQQLAERNPESLRKRRTLAQIRALADRADVALVEPNYRRHAARVPNDKYYGYQWHYPMINLPQAWELTTGTPDTGSVIVAVVDTGVVLGHEDLKNKLVTGYDFISDVKTANDGDGIDANPNDPGDAGGTDQSSWHGTHVAGTIGAQTNNGKGVAGVSWGARIMPLRVLGLDGGTTYDIMQALRYAAGLTNNSGKVPANRANIVNLSLGGGGYSQSEQSLYDQLYSQGILVVAAAGNEASSSPSYPASYNHVISVSAVDYRGIIASYSNRGVTVDIAAPGGDSLADRNGDGYGDGVLSSLVENDGVTPIYAFYEGTSMAAPHVAGVLALLKAVRPELTPAEVDAWLVAGQLTTEAGVSGRDNLYGYGIIDAAKAVKTALNGAAATITTADPTSLTFQLASPADSDVKSFLLTNIGSSVDDVAIVSDDVEWLSVALAAGAGSSLGPYDVTVTGVGLASGLYHATITVVMNSDFNLEIPVTLQVGEASVSGDAGYIYVLVYDPVEDQALASQQALSADDGSYAFTLTDVPAGNYQIIAGSDIDNDLLICGVGESCGAYPTESDPLLVKVSGTDITGLNFSVGISSTLASSTSATGAVGVYAQKLLGQPRQAKALRQVP